MQKKILFIVISLQALFCVPIYAQNHKHYVPLRTEETIVAREGDDMYEIKTFTTVYGQHNVIREINGSFLYAIPLHLQSLWDRDIVRVMSGDTLHQMIWSWFVIWDVRYTKTNISRQVSLVAVKISICSFIGFWILIYVLAYLIDSVARNRKQRFDGIGLLLIMKEGDYIWIWILLSAVIGFITSVVGVLFTNSTIHPDMFIYVPYAILIGYILHLLARLYKRLFPEQEKN